MTDELKTNVILLGEVLDRLRELPDNSVDTIITDPPYGLKFMHKSAAKLAELGRTTNWDYDVPSVEVWRECLRVAKPGAILLSFGGTRTYHRMVVNIEDAGWEIKPFLAWIYGEGFPKAQDLSRLIDQKLGAERPVVGRYQPPNGQEWNLRQADEPEGDHAAGTFTASGTRTLDITGPATPESAKWNGWKTPELKPAIEPICMAMKPLDGTYADNALKHGVAGLNIDGARIPANGQTGSSARAGQGKGFKKHQRTVGDNKMAIGGQVVAAHPKGRFPSNLILGCGCGCQDQKHVAPCPSAELDDQSGEAGAAAPVSAGHSGESRGVYGDYAQRGDNGQTFHGDDGGASRFFKQVPPNQHDDQCPVGILDDQTGILKTGDIEVSSRDDHFFKGKGAQVVNHVGGEGPASEYFKQVETHELDCPVGELQEQSDSNKSAGICSTKPTNADSYGGGYRRADAGKQIGHGDEGTAERFFKQVRPDGHQPDCPVGELNDQSGETRSGAMAHEVEGYEGDGATELLRGRSGPSNQHGDEGGAARFFQQVPPDPEHREGCPLAELDEQSGIGTSDGHRGSADLMGFSGGFNNSDGKDGQQCGFGDTGGATRYFYCAKPGNAERNIGLAGQHQATPEEMSGQKPDSKGLTRVREDGSIGENPYAGKTARAENHHPTVKPLTLMEYLCILTSTPEGGIVLDPYCGSGTTLMAAKRTGRQWIGIDRDPEYVEIANRRVAAIAPGKVVKNEQGVTWRDVPDLPDRQIERINKNTVKAKQTGLFDEN